MEVRRVSTIFFCAKVNLERTQLAKITKVFLVKWEFYNNRRLNPLVL